MTLIGGNSIYTDPRTDQHLREVLARVNRISSASDTDLTTLEVKVADLEATDGVAEVTFTPVISAGQPVYMTGSAVAQLAQADTQATSRVVGISGTTNITPGVPGIVVLSGMVTQSDWTASTGSNTLTVGDMYYLSASNPGFLTNTAPTTVGEYVVPIGRAVSTVSLKVAILNRILL